MLQDQNVYHIKKDCKDHDTNGKVTTSRLDISNENQDVSLFPAGDQKVSTNRST